MALMKEGLWGILSGTEVAPAQGEADKFTKFVTRGDKALAIIVLSIDPSLLYLLGDPEDPKVVWKKLADQFQKKTWANKLALRRRLNNLRLREGDSVQEMTEIFNDLSVIGAAMDEEDKVVTLLASLPDSFDMLLTALEANATVPSMETVTERMLHEERKLNERETSVTSSEKVLLGKKAKTKGPRCFSCNKFGHIKKFCNELGTGKQKDCTKGKQKASMTEEENPGSDCETLGFVTQAVAANVRDNKGEVWIIDSGATCHMRNNKDLLDDFVELDSAVKVQVGDGKTLNATGRGTVTLLTILPGGKHKKCKLKDVLVVPQLSYNLISVSKAAQVGYSVSFGDNECKITRANGAVIAVGVRVGCLYHLDFQQRLNSSHATNANSDNSKENIWHQRFGHLGTQNLNKLANENLVTGFDFDSKNELDFCESCVYGKLHKCPFLNSGAKRADEPLGLVHSDLCGKITPKSAGGAEYFLTFTDDKTRYVWVYALKQKSEVFSKFCEWKAFVEKSSGHKLKTLRTDNGGEFMSNKFQDYLKAEGV